VNVTEVKRSPALMIGIADVNDRFPEIGKHELGSISYSMPEKLIDSWNACAHNAPQFIRNG